MASHVPSLSSFKRQSGATEREKLEKDQAEAIAKAVNPVETSVKEKHIRSAIIGTWQEQGGGIFWHSLGKMPLPSQVIMCWKAMFLIHKLLREGHPKALEDSFKYRKLLTDMNKFWELSPKVGYGLLIAAYLKVLLAKLDFHKKNSFVPGNLSTSKDGRVQYASTDVNDYFQLSVEVFDYMDALIKLEKKIFSTLDRFHSNSQIAAVQCRICPFPVIVQECSGLYAISVDLMYRLHSSLPVDTLDGHRERFYNHFKELKSFYFDAGNMTYVKSLVVVPTLPENPPSFIPTGSKGVLTRTTSYEGPKTEKIPLPSKDPKRRSLMEPLTVAMSEPVVEAIIDENDFFGSSLQDGPPPPARFESLPDNKDNIIAELKQEILQLKQELQTHKAYTESIVESLRQEMARLEEELAVQKNILEMTLEENISLKKELEEKEDGKKVASDDKFVKLKNIYAKLREEHIQLLRGNAEVKQKLNASAKARKECSGKSETLSQELQTQKNELEDVKQHYEKEENARKLAEATVEQLTREHGDKSVEFSTQLQQAAKAAEEVDNDKKAKESEIQELESEIQALTSSSGVEISEITRKSKEEEEKRKTAEKTIENERAQHEEKSVEFCTQLQQAAKAAEELENEKKAKESKIQELESEIQALASSSGVEISEITRKRKEEEEKRKAAEETIENERAQHEEKISTLNIELKKTESQMKELQETKRKAVETIELERKSYGEQTAEQERKTYEDRMKSNQDIVVLCIDDAEKVIQGTLDQFDNPHHSSTTCTAEYLLSRLEGIDDHLDKVTTSFNTYQSNREEFLPLVSFISTFSYRLSDCLINAKATSHMAPSQEAQDLQCRSESAGKMSLELLEAMKSEDVDSRLLEDKINQIKKDLSELSSVAQALAPKEKDNAEAIGSEVDKEINATAELVADAALRIEEMLNKTRQKYTGVQLEVHGRILDSCTSLMQAIKVLIIKSKDLQEEIVGKGKGTATAREFYKRHHRWTEGLLSAAKAVGWGAKVLVDSADKVVQGQGKFEELVVASNEITASTAQLVAASRVKAQHGSPTLSSLQVASKGVVESAASVVASVKTGAEMIEDSKTVPDYSKLTLTQTKRMEMDSQVRLLELESSQTKEREKLGQLRRIHYQLAAAEDADEQ